MNKEDKELLLRDLCARLPYGLYVQDEYGDIVYISYNDVHFANYFDSVLNGTIKPYLFPLSSMSEEQKAYIHTNPDGVYIQIFDNVVMSASTNGFDNGFDWLNAYHFDYRGLIPKGLANDATGLNIY